MSASLVPQLHKANEPSAQIYFGREVIIGSIHGR